MSHAIRCTCSTCSRTSATGNERLIKCHACGGSSLHAVAYSHQQAADTVYISSPNMPTITLHVAEWTRVERDRRSTRTPSAHLQSQSAQRTHAANSDRIKETTVSRRTLSRHMHISRLNYNERRNANRFSLIPSPADGATDTILNRKRHKLYVHNAHVYHVIACSMHD
jgi:hypothetical protein